MPVELLINPTQDLSMFYMTQIRPAIRALKANPPDCRIQAWMAITQRLFVSLIPVTITKGLLLKVLDINRIQGIYSNQRVHIDRAWE